jgi:hypothetical protein
MRNPASFMYAAGLSTTLVSRFRGHRNAVASVMGETRMVAAQSVCQRRRTGPTAKFAVICSSFTHKLSLVVSQVLTRSI